MTKYSAIKTACNHGHTHDSKLEARRCNELHVLQAAGRIDRLTQQPVFNCSVNGRKICDYKADFAYFVSDARIIEDVKGVLTPVYRLKKKIVEAIHGPGIVITEWPVRAKKKRKTGKGKEE